MKRKQQLGLAFLLVLGLSLILTINTYQQLKAAENRELTKAVFQVA